MLNITYLHALNPDIPYLCESNKNGSKFLVQISKNMIFISNPDASNLRYYYHVNKILAYDVYSDKKNSIYYTVSKNNNHIAVAYDDDMQYALICKETK